MALRSSACQAIEVAWSSAAAPARVVGHLAVAPRFERPDLPVTGCQRAAFAPLSTAMSGPIDESLLASKLCSDLLTAADLRQLCQARGFPVTSGSKEQLAKSAAVRLLDLRDVSEAMAKLEPFWRKVLHLAAASSEPIAMTAIAPWIETDSGRWTRDYHSVWREVQSGLLAHGVMLATETLGGISRSRFARFQLVLPEAFRSELPPYPIEAVPTSGKAPHCGTMDDLLEVALRGFLGGAPGGRHPKLGTLPERLAAELHLKEDVLHLRTVQLPTAERISRAVRDVWLEGLHSAPSAPSELRVAPGQIVHHILSHLSPATACAGSLLAGELTQLGHKVKPEAVSAFCEEGVMAGFLTRFDRRGAEPLFRAADTWPLANRTSVELEAARGGGCFAKPSSALLSLLEIAAVARTTVEHGKLRFEPDPIRLGRAWRNVRSDLVAQLQTVSESFAQAARLVAEREGQVIVHRGLAVLRVEDPGLRALVCQRFAADVRALDRAYVACLSGKTDEVLAFAKKEGFVARRIS